MVAEFREAVLDVPRPEARPAAMPRPEPAHRAEMRPLRLTRAEYRTVREIALGRTYAEIAGRLGLREQTVKNTARYARERVGAQSMLQLFRLLGWLKVPVP